MAVDGLRYRCKCGFPCFSAGQEEYHRDGACLAIRLMVGVMAARERHGRHDHGGLEVAGMRLQRTAHARPTHPKAYRCTCGMFGKSCPVHRRAA